MLYKLPDERFFSFIFLILQIEIILPICWLSLGSSYQCPHLIANLGIEFRLASVLAIKMFRPFSFAIDEIMICAQYSLTQNPTKNPIKFRTIQPQDISSLNWYAKWGIFEGWLYITDLGFYP